MLRPDIATLDLNTMTFGAEVVINTPPNVRKMAKVIYAAGTKPEIELFDSGDTVKWFNPAKDLVYSARQRRQGRVRPHLGCREGRPEHPQRGRQGELRGEGKQGQDVRGKSSNGLANRSRSLTRDRNWH